MSNLDSNPPRIQNIRQKLYRRYEIPTFQTADECEYLETLLKTTDGYFTGRAYCYLDSETDEEWVARVQRELDALADWCWSNGIDWFDVDLNKIKVKQL